MTPNLRHLYAFREAARLNSIGAAAKAIHLSQPAVTQAISGIERHFNAQLLHRSNKGIAITQAGQICLDRIERALQQLQLGFGESAKETAPRPAELARVLTIAQLDALAAVVDHGTFSAAARAKKLSQPTIHRAARELERSLRVALFEKTSFGVVPTRDAQRLARRAKLAFAEIEQARAEIAALNGGEDGKTMIGAMPLARSYLIPKAVIEFTKRYSRHRVGIVEGTYEFLLGALKSGEVDFLIGAMRDPAFLTDVSQEHLFDDPLCIVVRSGHPLAKKKRVAVSTLVKYPWIAPRASSPLRVHFNDLFAAARVKAPHSSIECNSLAASRSLLVESDHVMLLSAHQIHYELRAGILVTLPHPAGQIVRPIGLTYRTDWRPTSSQEQLLQLLRKNSTALSENK